MSTGPDSINITGRGMFAGSLIGAGIGLSAGVASSVLAGIVGAATGVYVERRIIRTFNGPTADETGASQTDTVTATGSDKTTQTESETPAETERSEKEAETDIREEESADEATQAETDNKKEETRRDHPRFIEESGLQEGDVVRLDYTARTVNGGRLVDTTDPDIAEAEDVADQGTFEPRVIELGAGHLFPAVEDDIIGREVGDSGTVVLAASEAFGEYDESEVRTVSADRIPEDARYSGAEVEIDGEEGHVEEIFGGMARVNFNHPLAGKAITYEYEIRGEVTDDLERAEGLFNSFLDLGVDPEMHIETDGGETVLYIEATPQLLMNQQWMFQKQQIAQEIIEKTDIDRLVVQENLDGMGDMAGGFDDADDIKELIEETDSADIDLGDELEEYDSE